MPIQQSPDFTRHLDELRQSLDDWRREGRTPRRIPDQIWEQAVAMAAVYGVGPVAKDLHLDHAKLKSMLASKCPQGLVAARTQVHQEPLIPATFFELVAPAQLSSSLGQCVLSLESGRGGRMRVEVSGLDVPGLALLVREFVV